MLWHSCRGKIVEEFETLGWKSHWVLKALSFCGSFWRLRMLREIQTIEPWIVSLKGSKKRSGLCMWYIWINNLLLGLERWLSKSTDCSSRSHEFNSQQPHGGSQPSVTGSDALFWCVRRQLQCTHIHEINLKKKVIPWSPCVLWDARARTHTLTFNLVWLKINPPSLPVSLASPVEARWRRERHPLVSVATRRTRCAAAVAPRPTTFRSRLVASVATLPSARGSITGVPRLRDETLPGLVGWGT